MEKQTNLGSCFLYSPSAENRTKKKGSQQPSFLGEQEPKCLHGFSARGIFSKKRMFRWRKDMYPGKFYSIIQNDHGIEDRAGGVFYFGRRPLAFGRRPLAAETMLTTVWPRSCSGYRPQLSVVLGSPSCPSSLAVPAVRRPWQSRLSVVLDSPGCPGPPRPSAPPNGLANHSCAPADHPA